MCCDRCQLTKKLSAPLLPEWEKGGASLIKLYYSYIGVHI